MRRITVAIMGTLSALVALFSYPTSTSSTMASAGPAPSGTGTGTSGGTTSEIPSPASSSDSSGSAAGTFTGDAVDTRWGIVQVQITVANGKITKSEAVQYPNGNPRDQEINAFAVPELNAEAVSSQSGHIDAVSGATVTSDGYIQSLQSAIDQANL